MTQGPRLKPQPMNVEAGRLTLHTENQRQTYSRILTIGQSHAQNYITEY